jgi:hypothetical protein
MLFHPTTWASHIHFSRGTTVVLLACSAFTIICTGVVGFVTLVTFAKLVDWLDPIIERTVFGAARRDEDESSESLPPYKPTSVSPDIESGYIDRGTHAPSGQSNRFAFLLEKCSVDRSRTVDTQREFQSLSV